MLNEMPGNVCICMDLGVSSRFVDDWWRNAGNISCYAPKSGLERGSVLTQLVMAPMSLGTCREKRVN